MSRKVTQRVALTAGNVVGVKPIVQAVPMSAEKQALATRLLEKFSHGKPVQPYYSVKTPAGTFTWYALFAAYGISQAEVQSIRMQGKKFITIHLAPLAGGRVVKSQPNADHIRSLIKL